MIINRLFFSVIVVALVSCNRISQIEEPHQYPIGNSDNIFSDRFYYYHFAPNGFIIDGNNKKAIASESLEDIEIASRLCFDFVEANIWRTADGHYVCLHGTNGTFGPEVKSIDNGIITTTDLRNTKISAVTLEWIKNYVRYDSDYEQYQTSIPSLEEFCAYCKNKKIGILAGVGGVREAVEICVKYLGDSVVVYSPPSNIRSFFSGYVFTWNNRKEGTIEGLLRDARRYGAPYICSMGETLVSELKERNELIDFVEQMHNEGFLVGWAAVYSTELKSMDYKRIGMDVSASGHQVNEFVANYERFDLNDTSYFPVTTGTVIDDRIVLSKHEYVECGSQTVIPLGKGSLSIKFKGTVRISFGSMEDKGDRKELSSNGEELLFFSDYFFQRPTTLVIECLSDETTISHLEYCTSLS